MTPLLMTRQKKPATEGTEADQPEEKKAGEPALTIKVLEPEKPEEGSKTAEVIAALRSELASAGANADTQALALQLRKRLTADFGTIWHVTTGHDFVLEAAENRRNHVLLSTNKMRIVCFQHEQFKGGTKVDWGKLLSTLPYFLLAFFCFSYMTLNSMCNEENPDPSQKLRQSIRTRFCSGDWEGNLQYVGGGALACFFLSRRAKRAASSSAAEEVFGKAKTA